MNTHKTIKKLFIILIIGIVNLNIILSSGCNLTKGKYFVNSEYIIAKASLTSTVKNAAGEIEYYGIDITHESDIELNYLKYKCELYSNNRIIETFEDEVPMNGLYSKYIPLKTTKEYEHAKVTCTGWSDEDPKNHVRLNAKSYVEMQQCNHKNFISAKITSTKTNSKHDYIIIYYSSNTAFSNFRFFYENYTNIKTENAKVCTDCGFYVI